MVTLIQAIVLGMLQGFAEFLPVSSSAHLALAPWIFNWPDPGLAFDVALHVGTLLAVLWYFRNELLNLIRAVGQIIQTRKVVTVEQRRAVFLIIATIPGGLAGLFLNEYAESVFRSPLIIAWALIIMGIVLWFVDRTAKSDRPITRITWVDAVVIGLAQCLALIPGVSRSGSTITAGRFLGLDRNSAAAFSFLMSVPIIGAAAAVKVPLLVSNGGLTTAVMAGIIASAVSGAVAITVLLRYVSKHSYGVFAWYRVILGVIMLVMYSARG